MRIGEEAARGQSQRLAALSVPTGEFQRIVDARAARRSGLPHDRVSCASSRARNATPAPSRRCSATRSASPSTCHRLERRVGELYGQGNLEIFDYRLVQREPRTAASRARLRPGAEHAPQFLGS